MRAFTAIGLAILLSISIAAIDGSGFGGDDEHQHHELRVRDVG